MGTNLWGAMRDDMDGHVKVGPREGVVGSDGEVETKGSF